MSQLLAEIAAAILKGDGEKTQEFVEKALHNNIDPSHILEKGLVSGIQALGERFKNDEIYLPEVLISARAMNIGIDLLKPYLQKKKIESHGKIIIGTIEGDLHDIGKNLVKIMLEGNGFQVIDLGIDVSPAAFVREAEKNTADIIAISALLTTTMNSIQKVVGAVDQAGIDHKVKIMIGGAPVNREFANSIGVEGYAENCASAVDEAHRLVSQE